jgi:peptide/nickel transport system ATP-binding protein
MLEARNLTVATQQLSLMGPIDLSVAAGHSLVIMGESGAGKSLIAQAIMGSLPPSLSVKGEISLNGARIDDLSESERDTLWGKQIALLPQEPWLALDPLMKSIKQVSETHRLVAGHPRRAAQELAARDFKLLGLNDAEFKRADELSGGMCQRVAFAAALAGGAPVLLADEPTKGLDDDRARKIVRLLMQTSEKGGALIVITHDVAVANAVGGQMLVLKDGLCIEQGETSELLSRPRHRYTQELIAADPSNWESIQPQRSQHAVLTAKDLTVGHGETPLIERFDLSLARGERIAVTGPSGVGKTTLLDTLAGLLTPLHGTITRDKQIEPTGIQKIYQDPPAAFAKHVSLATSLKDVAKHHLIDWCEIAELLERLKVNPEMLSRLPSQVSGGELQRIAIARALAVRPAVLLADEPTSRLDPITQRMTMQLLASECEQAQTAVVLVTHDPDIAAQWATRSIPINH